MEDIVWFEKQRGGVSYKKNDCSINRLKNGYSIVVRNGLAEEMTKTDYMRIGFSKENKTRLLFMAADEKKGWKFVQSRTNPLTKTALVSDERMIQALARFEGDYNLEISDDNFFYIDRKNILD